MSSDAAVVSNPQPAPAAVKEDDEEFVPPPLVECDDCVKLQNQLEEAAVQQYDTNAILAATVAKLTEAEGEILSLHMNIVNQVQSFNKYKKEYAFFSNRNHELNRLRYIVGTLVNLGIPVKAMLAPDDMDLIFQMQPSAAPSAFINPLARTPSGAWGQIRVINHLDYDKPVALYNASGDYFITQAFTDYRQAIGKYFIDHRVFRCSHCLCPLHVKANWCLCMRCLAVPYCGTHCLHSHVPLHSLGCAPNHVWRTDIPYRAPYVPEEPTTSSSSSSSFSSSSSSSSSSNTDGGRNNKKRGRGQRDNSNKPCKFYTEKGSCNPKDGKTCDFKHCNEARKAHLLAEAAKLQ